jgi:hypothetical protein
VTETSHTCHVRYVYAWRYGSRHVHILTIVILGGGSCRIAACCLLAAAMLAAGPHSCDDGPGARGGPES